MKIIMYRTCLYTSLKEHFNSIREQISRFQFLLFKQIAYFGKMYMVGARM